MICQFNLCRTDSNHEVLYAVITRFRNKNFVNTMRNLTCSQNTRYI